MNCSFPSSLPALYTQREWRISKSQRCGPGPLAACPGATWRGWVRGCLCQAPSATLSKLCGLSKQGAEVLAAAGKVFLRDWWAVRTTESRGRKAAFSYVHLPRRDRCICSDWALSGTTTHCPRSANKLDPRLISRVHPQGCKVLLSHLPVSTGDGSFVVNLLRNVF